MRVTVSASYFLDVASKADHTEACAVQVGIQPDTTFVDFVAIEHGPTLLYASLVHQGELTLDDQTEILASAVQRHQEL
ncbi:MAG TPA: hypothetical protein VFH23_01270 [Jiangellaceae bacterium]|nr:hypothetical protein [Jiangellaceae bacterium]